jgi:excisionase family DNA binding protein
MSGSPLSCYSEPEAARLLGCSATHLRNLRRAGRIRFCRIGHRVVIRGCDLADFLDRNTHGGGRVA